MKIIVTLNDLIGYGVLALLAIAGIIYWVLHFNCDRYRKV